MKILISVCGEGFGHTTRCLAIGEELSKEHDVKFIAYGKSMDFIKRYSCDVFETYPEIKLSGNNGKFDIKKSIFNNKYNPAKAIKREMEIIRKYDPDLIISDCKYSTVVASRFLRKPYYIITNQNYTRIHNREKFIVYPVMKLLNVINKSAEKVIIPDLPMPYTICEYNLTKLDNLSFVGPIIRYKLDDYENERGDYILSVIGGFEYRFRILKLLNDVAEEKNIKVKMVCGSYEVAKKLNKIKSSNVEVIPLTTNMGNLIKNCSFIVCHGGHSTLMEAMSFGKPVITIPDLDHPEQENNARKINDLKCGIALSHKTLEHDLSNAIDEINDNDIYFKNAEKLSNICRNYNGRDNIKRIIDNYKPVKGVFNKPVSNFKI
ncbi:MJ1255/VC2487 family glycosyltransferase [Methanothermococcus sp.]|uniref:MJ1255/VC2487 family glycosyltransferase n=1 Tax=Methanothermococcus sp. TaxID=2614238 RepID=UPI0025DD2154|nr:MJ1255/VC2487 family glycosyltransferase [Methanothermococcus sp.]